MNDENEHTNLEEQPEEGMETRQQLENVEQLPREAEGERPLAPFPIAKFRQRIFASIIDTLLLCLVLWILAIPLQQLFLSMGPYGRLVTLVLMVVYYTVFNSHLKNGQTIGKRVMKIGVVNAQGSPIPIQTSFYRAFLYALLIIANQWALPLFGTQIGAIFASLFVWGLGLMFTYTLLFNRATKQTAIDLLLGTFVIQKAEQTVPVQPPPALPIIHRRMLIGIGAFVVLITLSGSIWGNWISGRIQPNLTSLSELQPLYTELYNPNLFHAVTVNIQTRTSLQTGSSLTDLEISAWLKKDCQNFRPHCDEIIDTLAEQAFDSYSGINELDGMTVAISRRMDLGILTTNRTQGVQFRIEDWEERLGRE